MFVENLRISGGEPYKVNRGDFMIDRKTLTINTQIGAVSIRGAAWVKLPVRLWFRLIYLRSDVRLSLLTHLSNIPI